MTVFQGYAPDTDLDNVRNRVVGILFGLLVTAFAFNYIWPEWSERGWSDIAGFRVNFKSNSQEQKIKRLIANRLRVTP